MCDFAKSLRVMMPKVRVRARVRVRDRVRVRVRVRVGVKPTNFSSKESALTPRDAAALILAGRPFFQH